MHPHALLGSLPVLFFVANASALPIINQEVQTRSLNADVIVGADRESLIGEDHGFDAAINFAPLNSEVDANVAVPDGGHCSAVASQNSVMLSHSIVAICHGHVFTEVIPLVLSDIPVRSVGASQFAVRFEIEQPTPFTFYVALTSFDIGVAGEGSVTATLSRVEPSAGGGATIVSADAQAVYAHTVVHAGTLEAGEYVLHVHTTASGNYEGMGIQAFIFHYAEAGIKLSLGESPSADLNDDGVVDSYDLASLLSTWSPCGGGCSTDPAHMLADLDNNSSVNGGDLALLLGQWTLDTR